MNYTIQKTTTRQGYGPQTTIALAFQPAIPGNLPAGVVLRAIVYRLRDGPDDDSEALKHCRDWQADEAGASILAAYRGDEASLDEALPQIIDRVQNLTRWAVATVAAVQPLVTALATGLREAQSGLERHQTSVAWEEQGRQEEDKRLWAAIAAIQLDLKAIHTRLDNLGGNGNGGSAKGPAGKKQSVAIPVVRTEEGDNGHH